MERLALQYRPRRYEDIVGQDHVVTILKKMHEKNIVPTGMLFQGSRGTGKTTMARCYSMRINCGDVNGPCGVCASCKHIIGGTSNSVSEIDAASHGLVEDVRQIKDRSQYAHGGKYRVWLIDEAHMLSAAANNGLLKILEEPPVNTLFILVTTEPEGIKETVRSRLMPFEFRRVNETDLINRLRFICDSEKLVYEMEALASIADYAEGGVRDAIVMIEQLYFYEEKITLAGFEKLYGVVGRMAYDKIFDLLFRGNHIEGQKVISECFVRASEGRQFLKGLLRYLTDILISKQGADIKVNEEIANSWTVELLLKTVDEIWDMMTRVRYSTGSISFVPSVLYCKLIEIVGIRSIKAEVKKSSDDKLSEMRGLL